MGTYETAYCILYKAMHEAIIKIKKLEIKEAMKNLEDGTKRAEEYIDSLDKEI